MRHTATELCEHERFHTLMNENPGASAMIWEKVDAELRDSRYDRLMEQYVQAYLEAYEGDEARIQEELMADAYAGLNRFGEMPEVQRMVRELAQQFESGEAADLLQGQVEPGVRSSQTAREQNRTRDGTRFSYSLGQTTDNKPFVEVEQDILAGVPETNWVKTVKENLKKKFPNGITVGNNEINIDKQSRREMTFSRYMQRLYNTDPQLRADKLRATNNADEILRATTDWVNEGLNHPRKDNIRDFARGEVLLRVGRNDYAADVVVGTRANGSMLMYDILNLQPTSFTEKETDAAITVNPSPGAGRSTASVSADSIAERAPSVKGQYSLTQATEGRKMSSRARRDVNQTMNAVQTELRGLIEAETRAARDTQKQVLAELAQTALDGKNISQEQINDAFETVWNAGRVVDRSAGEAAWDVKEYLRTQGVALSEADQALTARRRRCSI